MRLIITEKNDAAKKIAGILAGTGSSGVVSEGPLLPLHRRRRASRPRPWVSRATWCRWTSRPSSPSGARWSRGRSSTLRWSRPRRPSRWCGPSRSWRRTPPALIIATDFDREGELIGLEALNLAVEENAKLVRTVRRARFSALTAGRDQAGLLASRPPLRAAGPGRRGPAGHRPHLGRHAHPLRLAGHRAGWAASS